jgi:hypothetical protein
VAVADVEQNCLVGDRLKEDVTGDLQLNGHAGIPFCKLHGW